MDPTQGNDVISVSLIRDFIQESTKEIKQEILDVETEILATVKEEINTQITDLKTDTESIKEEIHVHVYGLTNSVEFQNLQTEQAKSLAT